MLISNERIERKRLRHKQKLHRRSYCHSNTKTFKTTTKECQKTKDRLYCYLSSFVLCTKQFKMSLLRKALQKKNKSRNSGDDWNNNTNTYIEPLEQQQGKIIYHEIWKRNILFFMISEESKKWIPSVLTYCNSFLPTFEMKFSSWVRSVRLKVFLTTYIFRF